MSGLEYDKALSKGLLCSSPGEVVTKTLRACPVAWGNKTVMEEKFSAKLNVVARNVPMLTNRGEIRFCPVNVRMVPPTVGHSDVRMAAPPSESGTLAWEQPEMPVNMGMAG